MIVEDIPAGEQLMDTSAIGSVPPPLKSYLDGLEWPAAGAPSIPRTPINQELRADSIHWITSAQTCLDSIGSGSETSRRAGGCK